MKKLKRLVIIALVMLSVTASASALIAHLSQEKTDEAVLIAGNSWGGLQSDDKPDDGDPPPETAEI